LVGVGASRGVVDAYDRASQGTQPSTMESTFVSGAETSLCQGCLEVPSSEGAQPQYFVLHGDRLAQYSAQRDFTAGAQPIRQVLISQVMRICVTDSAGFAIMLPSGMNNLLVQAPGSADFVRWKLAFEDVLGCEVKLDLKPFTAGDPIIHQGGLGVKKSADNVQWRHFVLFGGCFHYYMAANEFDQGLKPKGQIQFSDIISFTVEADSFIIQVKEGKMNLCAKDTREFDEWKAAWQQVNLAKLSAPATPTQPLRAPRICHQGPLENVKKEGGVTQLYFVLFEDHIAYFSSANDFSSGVPPRGKIAFVDIKKCIFSADSFTLFRAKGEVSFRARKTEEIERWKTELAQVLEVVEEASSGLICQGPVEMMTSGVTTMHHLALFEDRFEKYSDETKMSERAAPMEVIRIESIDNFAWVGNSFVLYVGDKDLEMRLKGKGEVSKWKPALEAVLQFEDDEQAAEVKKPVYQGELGIVKKEGVQLRFCILFDDCLSFFDNASDFNRGQEPQTQVLYEDLISFSVAGDTITVHVARGKMQLRPRTAAEFDEWTAAWVQVLTSARPQLLLQEESSDKPEDPERTPKPKVGKEDTTPKKDDPSQKQDVTIPTNPSSLGFVQASSMPENPPPIKMPTNALCEGSLKMLDGSAVILRYCVLTSDSFEYFADVYEYQDSTGPGVKVQLSDINEFEDTDDGFTIELFSNKTLQLKTTSGDDFKKWKTAWDTVLENEEDEEPIHNGPLGVKRKDGTQVFHFVLFDDQIQHFKSKGDAQPSGVVNKEDVRAFTIVDDCFVIQEARGKMTLVASSSSEFDVWKAAFKKVFTLEEARGPTVEEARGPMEVLHKGSLKRVKGDGSTLNVFFIVFDDRLEHYQSVDDATRGVQPTNIMHSDVTNFFLDERTFAFSISVAKGALTLRTSGLDDFLKWKETLEKVYGVNKALGVSPVANVDKDVMCQGLLGIVKNGSSQSRYCIMHQDYFEYYNSAEKYESGSEARGKILYDEVEDLDSLEDEGFTITTTRGKIQLKTAGLDDFKKWKAAWDQVFTVDGSDGEEDNETDLF